MSWTELEDSLASALGEYGDDYDIDAIAHELRQHGCATVDDINPDEFWAVVDAHSLSDTDIVATDSLTTFQAEVTQALLTQRGARQPAVWRRGGVTMTIKCPLRVNPSWPQVLTDVEVTVTDGPTVTIDGDDIESWQALWDIVSPLLEGWTATVATRRDAVALAQCEVDRLAAELHKARADLRSASTALDAALPEDERAVGAYMTRDQVAEYLGIAPGSVPRQMSRWGIKAIYQRGASRRPEAGYPTAEVEARASGRPGRGHRSDLDATRQG